MNIKRLNGNHLIFKKFEYEWQHWIDDGNLIRLLMTKRSEESLIVGQIYCLK